MTRIKICGITHVDDAYCACEAGVDFLGFILYSKSPRCVHPAQVADVISAMRGEFGALAPRFVGVFVDEPPERVREIMERTGLDLAQLHGSEPPHEVATLAPRAFKALRPQTLDEARAAAAAYRPAFLQAEDLPQLLLDAYHPQRLGGTGTQADPKIAAALAGEVRLLLAGGLAPDTVGEAIARVAPWGVDVSSGVELAGQPGHKDRGRVRALVAAVRAASAGPGSPSRGSADVDPGSPSPSSA
jgi:phosphoribosylanthranilate isomerase